jgi:hypothetical protein
MTKLIPVHAVSAVPVACTLDGAGQNERLDEFRQLFADALIASERTVEGIRFRFTSSPGIEARVRDLARREAQCCAFYTFTITLLGGEVLWDATVASNDETSISALDLFLERPAALGVTMPATKPQGKRRSTRSPFALTGIVGVVLCAAACAAPLLGIAFFGGLAAFVCNPRVLLGGATLVVGGLGAAAFVQRRRTAASSSNGSCGC